MTDWGMRLFNFMVGKSKEKERKKPESHHALSGACLL
jgi:hypothetical protein